MTIGQLARKPPWLRAGLVVLLLLAAVTTRFYRLGSWSLWGDEFYTVNAAEQYARGERSSSFAIMPLAFLPTLAASAVIGAPITEYRLRFFPAVFGVLFICVFLFAGERLLGRREAFVAAALATLCPWLVFQSQCARYYSQLLVLSAVSSFLYLIAVKRHSMLTMMLSACCFVLAGLTHPQAYVLLPVHCLHFAVTRGTRPSMARWRLLWPWLVTVAIAAVGACFRLVALRQTIGYSLALTTGDAGSPIDLLQGLAYNLGIPLAPLCLIGLLLLWQQDRSTAAFLLLLATVPLVAIAVLSVSGRPMDERYLIPSLPAYFILAAKPVAEIDRALSRARPRLRNVAFLATALPYLPGLVSHYLDGDRHDMRAAAQFVRQNARLPPDLILADQHVLFAWYAHIPRWLLAQPEGAPVSPIPALVDEAPLPLSKPLKQQLKDWPEGELWVVIPDEFSKAPANTDRGEFARWTDQHCRMVAEFYTPRYDYHQNILRVYQRR